jgi:GT2 family glycosyltransferase
MDEPRISITILAYRSRQTIQQCIRSAMELRYEGPVDIHVREQGNDEEEFRLIREFLDAISSPPHRRLLVTRGENVGFAAGHNILIRESKGEFILCLNADAVLHPDFLLKALPAFSDPTVGAVQGKLYRWDVAKNSVRYGPHGKPLIDTTGLQPLRNRRVINRGQGEEDVGQYDRSSEVFGADGAAPLYRRAALTDIAIPQKDASAEEYFDEDFFSYKEDVDLAWRLRWRGWKTIFVPDAIAWHARGSGDSAAHDFFAIIAERRKISPKAKYYSFSNQRLMQLKNETVRGLMRDLIPIAFKELGAWTVALITERQTIPALIRMVRLVPRMLTKRRWIMSHRKPDANPYRWFT